MDSTSIDMTVCLFNRTAVYDIAGELFDLLPAGSAARFWRMWLHSKPEIMKSRILSLIASGIHKFSSRDFSHISSFPWPRQKGSRMLFVESLYCARTPIESEDIVYCYDIGPITHPEAYNAGAKDFYDLAFRRMQIAKPTLVFISEGTKNGFLARYPAAYKSVSVISLYCRPVLKAPLSPPEKQSRMILMVGGLERRKNHTRAIEAFLKSGLTDAGYKLVLAGCSGNCSEQVLNQIRGSDVVKHVGFVDDLALAALYEKADVFLFPSLLEGFGVPAIEATRFGAVPVVSKGTVLEEVVGPDGIIVDPYSVDSIARGLSLAATLQPQMRSEIIGAICSYQRRFDLAAFRESWRRLLAA
jgi:glycosyltransferase involved in cell wall biosynthesis